MKAVVISKPGGPEVLSYEDVDDPIPQDEDVLVRVKATAVNRADCIQRMGRYPAPPGVPANIPGLEFSGVIESVGRSARGVDIGEKVYGLVGGGSYAELITVHHRAISRIPEGLSFTQAAAIPEAYITAYDAIVEQGGLGSGDWLLIHAATSGVGTAAIQIAHGLGARSIGTTRSDDKVAGLQELGLQHIIVAPTIKFAERVKQITGGSGADVVLELVGGDYVSEDLECIAGKGRIILVGLLAGAKTELNLATLLRSRALIRGTTMRARPLEEKIEAARLLSHRMGPLFESGTLKPIIDKTFPLSQASSAHEYMESNESFGKLVLTI